MSAALLFCIAVELLLAWVTGPKLLREWRQARWAPTPAVVVDSTLASRVEREEQRFEPRIRFQYTFGGIGYTNDSTRLSVESFPDAESAQRLLARYPAGMRFTCYVDPQAPENAVLSNNVQYWVLIMFFMPVMLWAIVDFRRINEWWEERQQARQADTLQPLTANLSLRKARRYQLLIGLMCLGMSSLFVGWTLAWPFWKSWSQTRSWQETSCVVEDIRIGSSNHHHGDSFTPEVQFRYTFGGREYVGSQLDCSSDTGLGRAEAKRRLKGVRLGRSRCFVNPDDPVQAVLRRTFYVDRFFGPFSGAFFAVSSVMFLSSLRAFRKRRSARQPSISVPVVARLRHVPPALLLAGTLAAGFCCAGASWWVGMLWWEDFRSGVLNFLEAIYVLMLLAGATFCFWCSRLCWWGVLSPPPRVNVSPGVITLGSPVEIDWSFPSGRSSDRVRFWLEGREEATVIHWVDTGHNQMKEEKKEKAVFAALPIADAQPIAIAREGQRRFIMPADSMHSFDGVKTRIRWLVRAQRIRPRGEPIEYDFPVEVRVPTV